MKKIIILIRVVGFLVIVVFINSCSGVLDSPNTHLIYLSHTRLEANDSVYKPVYNIDFSKFDMTLLGGDLAANSFANETVTRHLDDTFDFKNPSTLWSIGNHDETTLDRWERATLKKKYNATSIHDITVIVLNSQDSLSSIVGSQKEFLFNTLDSLHTNTIILMTHKLIFMNDHPVMDAMINTSCNAGKGDCFYCHNENNFQDVIYPKLLELKNKGVQVIWVGGDLGYKKSQFEYVDKNGITFLGNGVWYPEEGNKALIFSKQGLSPMTYAFVSLDSISLINRYGEK